MTNLDLRARAERLTKLEEAVEAAKLDLKAAYEAAASAGYTSKALKAAIRLHRMDADKSAKHESEQMDLELYLAEIEGRARSLKEAAE